MNCRDCHYRGETGYCRLRGGAASRRCADYLKELVGVYAMRWPADAPAAPPLLVEGWQVPSHKSCGWELVGAATSAQAASLARQTAAVARGIAQLGTTE